MTLRQAAVAVIDLNQAQKQGGMKATKAAARRPHTQGVAPVCR
jgi:hypothetical protein